MSRDTSTSAPGRGDASSETKLTESIAAYEELNDRFEPSSSSCAKREATMATQLADYKQLQEDATTAQQQEAAATESTIAAQESLITRLSQDLQALADRILEQRP